MRTRSTKNTISLLFALLLLFTSNGLGSGYHPADPRVFVQINLSAPETIYQLDALDIPIHKQLHETAWLTFVNRAQRASLETHKIAFSILDEHPSGKDYFLIKANTPNTRPGLQLLSTELARNDEQIIVTVEKDQVDDFFTLGYALEQISPDPIPYPQAEARATTPQAIEPHPTIAEMLDEVNKSAVYKMVGDLSGEQSVMISETPYTIVTRHSSNAIASEMVTQYAYEQFEALGLSMAYHNYNHTYYGARRNIIAEQTGSGQPERIFLITAHIDDMPSGSTAPGADDNASGSTGVLLAARILSQYDCACTLRYALFTGEEQGLIGSQAYAADAYAAGDDIEAVLNLDMIAYNSDKFPIVDLHTRTGNSGDLAIANMFAGVIEAYDINLTANIFQSGMGYSDHASFWNFGYPAILAIEDNDDFTPYYHTTGDTLATLDTVYFSDFVKASLATVAHMGCLQPDEETYYFYLPIIAK